MTFSNGNSWDQQAAQTWATATVLSDQRCSVELWHQRNYDRTTAQTRCDNDSNCKGLHWYNNQGYTSMTSCTTGCLDGRTADFGWYQGCGSTTYSASGDWDVILKPNSAPAAPAPTNAPATPAPTNAPAAAPSGFQVVKG